MSTQSWRQQEVCHHGTRRIALTGVMIRAACALPMLIAAFVISGFVDRSGQEPGAPRRAATRDSMPVSGHAHAA